MMKGFSGIIQTLLHRPSLTTLQKWARESNNSVASDSFEIDPEKKAQLRIESHSSIFILFFEFMVAHKTK